MVYFHSFSAFIHMGGYADYIWPTYALVLLSMAGLWFLARRRLRKLLKIKR